MIIRTVGTNRTITSRFIIGEVVFMYGTAGYLLAIEYGNVEK
jgi:hypothetical protein